jgi:NAD(P)-dependent dehydrogenase (short-subunit alcohol dehydrogenase family)
VIEGAVAIVTGGASGIGAATARLLAGAGARVAIVDRDVERGAAVADEAGRFLAADVARPEDWSRVVDEVTRWWGPISLVHLNAGVPTAPYPFSVEDVTVEQYQRIRGVNFDGVLLGVRAVIPSMAAAGGGAIVVTASVAGLLPFADDPYYAATKHGVVAFVRSVAPQLAAKNVRINAVCPSATDTPILDPRRRALIERERRVLQSADDVAGTVVDLLRSGDTGEAWMTKAGRAAQRWRFPGDAPQTAAGAPAPR